MRLLDRLVALFREKPPSAVTVEELLKNRAPGQIRLGYTEAYDPVHLTYRDLRRHIAVFGEGKAGLSNLLNIVLVQHAAQGGGFLYLDGNVDADTDTLLHGWLDRIGRGKDFDRVRREVSPAAWNNPERYARCMRIPLRDIRDNARQQDRMRRFIAHLMSSYAARSHVSDALPFLVILDRCAGLAGPELRELFQVGRRHNFAIIYADRTDLTQAHLSDPYFVEVLLAHTSTKIFLKTRGMTHPSLDAHLGAYASHNLDRPLADLQIGEALLHCAPAQSRFGAGGELDAKHFTRIREEGDEQLSESATQGELTFIRVPYLKPAPSR